LSAVVNNCVLSSNWAGFDGGGAYYGTLNNCIVCGNQGNRGGGVAFATLNNCTVSMNWSNSFKASPPGAYSCTLTNCVVYHNAGANYSYCTFNYSCTTPLPDTGTGNITSDPAFVDLAGRNLRLQSNSPCIDTGNNSFVVSATDLDGRPRIAQGTVDMGAYEFQAGASGSFIGWLQTNGLPTDGSADFTDLDGDGLNNWQEWRSGTDPANPSSVLKMLVPLAPTGPPNVTLTWQSVSGVIYYLERSTNLAALPAFSGLQSNLVGEAVRTSYIDRTVPASGPIFYRIGVQ